MKTRILNFLKEDDIWYAVIPEFLEAGLGTRSDLIMIDGADTFLDLLSNNGSVITLLASPEPFAAYTTCMKKIKDGLNPELLEIFGHEKVEYGSYYDVFEHNDQPFHHRLWLCPVTEYVFGYFPDRIFITAVKF